MKSIRIGKSIGPVKVPDFVVIELDLGEWVVRREWYRTLPVNGLTANELGGCASTNI